MSLGNRFNPARGLLTGVALENNDALAAGLPAEELPPVDAALADPAAVPTGDALDTPAVVDAPAATDPTAPAADPVVDPAAPAADVPAADPAVDPAAPAVVDAPAADPINVDEPAAPAADPVVDAPVVDVPAADPAPAVVDAPAADPISVDEPAVDPAAVPAPVADPAPVVEPAPAAADPAAPVDAAPAADPIQGDALEDLSAIDTQLGEQDAGIETGLDEVAGVTNQIQDGQNNVDELNAIADSLQGTMETEGGATKGEISVANIAVEHALMRMNGGHKPRHSLMPALESFGGLRSRASSTKLAIESLRGAAASAGEKIMQFIQKCIGFLKGLIEKISDNFGAMKQKLVALAAAAKQGKLAQGAVKVSSGIASRLKIGGKFGKQQFVKGMRSMKNVIAKISALLGAAAKTVASANFSNAGAGGDDTALPEIDVSALGAAVKAFGGKSVEAEEGTVTVSNMEALPGDATLYVNGPDVHVVGDVAYRAVGSVDVNITSVSQENDAFPEIDETVTEAEFAQMIRELNECVEGAERMRGIINSLVQAQSAVAKNVATVDKQGTGGRIVQAAQSFASRGASSLTRSASKSMIYIRSVLTGALMYLSLFVGNGQAAPAAAAA